MKNLQIIEEYKNRFFNYSGISLNDQFHFFHVSKDMSEENEKNNGSQAGILRYDDISRQHILTLYPSNIHFESYTPGKTVIHMASLEWNKRNATLSIYKFDCTTMKEMKVFTHSLIDNLAEDIETSSLWRIELYSLDDNYILIKLPDLDPFSKQKNYGFSECLLIDIENKKAHIVPPYLNEQDSLLNISHIERYTYLQNDFLIISTGRVSMKNKRESWEQREHQVYNTLNHQTRLIVPLNEFIDIVKQKTDFGCKYIVDECNFSKGYMNTVFFEGTVYFLKIDFSTSSSEIIQYELSTRKKQSLNFTLEFEKIMISEKRIIGVTSGSKDIQKKLYFLNTHSLSYDLEVDHSLEFFSSDLIITRYTDNYGIQHITFYNPKTNKIIKELKGERVALCIVKSKEDQLQFLVHIEQI